MRTALLLIALGLMHSSAFAQPNTTAASDAAIALHVCTDTAYLHSPSDIGATADLNPTNGGCLLANERQGVWMHFRIASAGEVGFTIAPMVPGADYDFAVWGPFTAPVTEVDAPPLRCNFSATTGAGGLNFSAQALSVGPGGAPWSRYIDVLPDEWYMLYVDNYSMSGLGFNLTWQLQSGASLGCMEGPMAAFMASTTLIEAGSAVDFTDLSTGYAYQWNWSFPGGQPSESEAQHPSGILYDLPGCYDVSLAVVSAAGQSTLQELCVIVVEQATGVDAPPDRAFRFSALPDLISLVMEDGSSFRYAVRDAQGRTVTSGSATGSMQLATADWALGAYTVEAISAEAPVMLWRFVR